MPRGFHPPLLVYLALKKVNLGAVRRERVEALQRRGAQHCQHARGVVAQHAAQAHGAGSVRTACGFRQSEEGQYAPAFGHGSGQTVAQLRRVHKGQIVEIHGLPVIKGKHTQVS